MTFITPDSFPGVRQEEGLEIRDAGVEAVQQGEERYTNGAFSFFDAKGEYDPRSIASGPTQVGQVAMSLDGETVVMVTPVLAAQGQWLRNASGNFMIKGISNE